MTFAQCHVAGTEDGKEGRRGEERGEKGARRAYLTAVKLHAIEETRRGRGCSAGGGRERERKRKSKE